MADQVAKYYKPSKKFEIEKDIFKTSINDLFYKQHKKLKDDRGYFSELTKIFRVENALGKDFKIQQVNYSHSITNVIRGMHAENWNKIVTVVSGKAFCAIADIRPHSSTFGNVEYFVFEPEKTNGYNSGLIIGAGLANSICAITGPVGYLYGVDMLYEDRDTSGDQAISIFDPDLNIQWPIPRNKMIISQRDIDSVTLRELYPEKF